MRHDDDAWFAPKRYGYGAGSPIAWQGWAVIGAYVAVVCTGLLLLPRSPNAFYAVLFVASTLLIAISATEIRGGWHCRWGQDG